MFIFVLVKSLNLVKAIAFLSRFENLKNFFKLNNKIIFKMKKIVVFLIGLIAVACQNDQPAAKLSLDIEIEGMSCSHSCAPFIQKKLSATDGVLDAKVSYENKRAEVIINSNDVSKEEILEKIESINNGSYKTGRVAEKKLEDSDPKESNHKDSKSSDFDISKPGVSHSSSFQLPNLFSLLNSILN